jgi:lysophospholipase L1-like esterase
MNKQQIDMKKISTLFILIFLAGNTVFSQTWDILDKSMAAWNVNGGSQVSLAWTSSQKGNGIRITQNTGYVNISKTEVAASNNYAFLIPQPLTVSPNTAYSIEIKARVHAIEGENLDLANTEAHQISARLNARNMAVFLKYGDESGGYIALSANAPETERYYLNTGEWHVYRFVFYADNTGYDVYLDNGQDPVFETAATTSMSGSNILRLGAESTHRCNIDIEYARMGTGDFWSKLKILSLALSSESQIEGRAATLIATANTALMADGEQLQAVIVNADNQPLMPAMTVPVSKNSARFELSIPETAPRGEYSVIVSAPGGKVGETAVTPRKADYTIYTSRFVGKSLVTFGNSITIAANSWAYQTGQKLGFGSHYNGAMSASIWCKREKIFDDGSILRTQNYYDSDFAGITTLHFDGMTKEEWQKRLNNCAIVHLQKYLWERKEEIPDCVIFSYGTNDPPELAGNPETDLETPYTMAGAIKWSIDTLQTLFPEAEIYLALPLQASAERNKNAATLQKILVMKAVADSLSIPVFDCFHESGITEANQSKYLSDGLHPNEIGKNLHSQYIISKLSEMEPETAIAVPKRENRKSIVVSSSVLGAGETLSLRSVKNGVCLTEATLYDVAGNGVTKKTGAETEYTIRLPERGIYILAVRLVDNSAETFKILVL